MLHVGHRKLTISEISVRSILSHGVASKCKAVPIPMVGMEDDDDEGDTCKIIDAASWESLFCSKTRSVPGKVPCSNECAKDVIT